LPSVHSIRWLAWTVLRSPLSRLSRSVRVWSARLGFASRRIGGSLRRNGEGYRKTDRTQAIAVVTLDALDPRVLRVIVGPPALASESGEGAFRPTALMERVSRFLEGHPGEPLASNEIDDRVPGKREYVLAAVDCLTAEGFVARETTTRARGDDTPAHLAAAVPRAPNPGTLAVVGIGNSLDELGSPPISGSGTGSLSKDSGNPGTGELALVSRTGREPVGTGCTYGDAGTGEVALTGSQDRELVTFNDDHRKIINDLWTLTSEDHKQQVEQPMANPRLVWPG